jgi:tRNA 2-thiocytidine biosynthesis protein TtcA
MLAQQRRKIGKALGLALVAGHIPGTYRGQPTAKIDALARWCREREIDFVLSHQKLKDDTFHDCFRCSMARRKLLFDLAEQSGCSKIALGHNADDMVETAMLNIFFAGHLAAINPSQPVLNGKLRLIRPLSYVWKEEILRYAADRFGRIKSFTCPGARDNKRLMVRRLLQRLENEGSPVKANILKAITNPKFEYLPMPPQGKNH